METYYSGIILILSFIYQLSLADQHADHQETYGYSDYYPHSYVNKTQSRTSGRQKRVFDESLVDYAASVSVLLRARIPLTDLNSAISLSAPFYFDFPPTTGRGSTDYLDFTSYGTGRSLSSGAETGRVKMYKEIETYVNRITGADGHHCLLRAMCETSANPLHDDGILGDAMNFLMTGSYSIADSLSSDKSYFEAQAKGQLSGDCSPYHQHCPVSFFKYFG